MNAVGSNNLGWNTKGFHHEVSKIWIRKFELAAKT